MTPGNKRRVEQLAENFRTLAQENPNASTVMYAMLKAQRMILVIMEDVHFRPEVNS